MFKPLTLALALTLTAAVHADTDCNVSLREGTLIHLANPSEVEYQGLKLIGDEKKSNIKAKEGFRFAELTLKIATGRSVGLYDYALKPENGNEEFKAAGMKIGSGPFQRTIWEVRASGENKVQWDGIYDQDKPSRKGSEVLEANAVVKLLFEVPENSGKRFKLVSRLLDKSLQKEYGVQQILDFDDMSKAAAPSKPEAKAGSEEEAGAKTQ
ncbi:MAG: hypothetical protein MK132_16680 [Lentisphaerales bacterium]|nr:hypothetical protein [Lentisphaerales bacterium]